VSAAAAIWATASARLGVRESFLKTHTNGTEDAERIILHTPMVPKMHTIASIAGT